MTTKDTIQDITLQIVSNEAIIEGVTKITNKAHKQRFVCADDNHFSTCDVGEILFAFGLLIQEAMLQGGDTYKKSSSR